jgi:hypothetical protein
MTTEQTHPPENTPWLSRRRFWGLVAVGLVAMFLVTAAGIYYGYVTDVPLRISRETTYITEPLTADGKRVDYFAAAEQLCYPPEMATDENGFRMIVQALGVGDEFTEEQRREIYEKLGIDPNVAPTMSYMSPVEVLQVYAEGLEDAGELPPEMELREYVDQLEDRLEEPWTVADLPMLEGWLEENSIALDLIAEAVRKPEFCAPWVRTEEQPPLATMSLVGIQEFRDYARGFNARCHHRLAGGDVDGAIDDIVSCARLGRHLQNAGTVIENLVGVACEVIADAMGAGGSLEHQPTAEQWRRLQDDLGQLRERRGVEHSLEFERLGVLDAIQAIAWGEETPDSRLLEGRGYGLDWNLVMHQANERFDQLLIGASDESPNSSKESLQRTFSRSEHSRLAGDQLGWRLCPALNQYREARRRIVCKEQLLHIAIAMLLYEKDHGTLPPAYSVDAAGNPLHSWRVLLLPYLGYDELHSQIRLDEPWNSMHNSRFHAADVVIYQCPTGEHPDGQTVYTVIEGDTTAFNGGEGKRLDSFGPKSANLILVAERLDPICWMNPTQEIPLSLAVRGINTPGATDGLGSEHERGLHMAFRSGAVEFVIDDTSHDELQGMLEGTSDDAP